MHFGYGKDQDLHPVKDPPSTIAEETNWKPVKSPLFWIKGPIREKLKEKEMEGHNNSHLSADLEILYTYGNIRESSTC